MELCDFCDVVEKHTIGLLDESTVWVNALSVQFGLLFSQSENVFQTTQRHLHYLWVHHCQQVTHGFNGIQRHQISVHTRRTFIFIIFLNFKEINWLQLSACLVSKHKRRAYQTMSILVCLTALPCNWNFWNIKFTFKIWILYAKTITRCNSQCW